MTRMSAALRRVPRDDAGFTLPELLVAIVVSGIIMPVIFAVFVSAAKTTDGNTERISASRDGAMASSWFVPDVQSAESISVVDEPTCKSPGTRMLTLKRTTGTSTMITGYALVSGTPLTLVRYSCVDGTPTPTVTIANDLAADPKVECPPLVSPTPCLANSRRVTLSFTDTSGYAFTLDATRRTSA